MWIDMDQTNVVRTIGSLLFWSLSLSLWWWNGFLRDLISILRICRSVRSRQNIVEHRRVPHVCSFYDIYQE